MKYLFILVLLVGTVLAIEEGNRSLAQPQLRGEVVWRLATNAENSYRGPVQQAAYDRATRVTYLATMVTLYRVQNQEVRAISESPEREARLALAPGSGVYAWLLPDSHGYGLFYIRLYNMSGERIGELRLKDFPYGFSTLYLGTQGRLILTASPLDDWRGIKGRFQFNFWNRTGEMFKRVILPDRQVGIVGMDGKAVLLLGKEKTFGFSASGEELPQLSISGRYRKAAVAREGNLALLNPSSREEINQVHVHEGRDKPRIVRIDTPVHDLILTPDGSKAVVVGDLGRYFLLDPSTGSIREGTRLPFDGTFSITNLKFVDKNTIAMGVLHRVGEPPKVTWPRGTILVTDLGGNVIFREDILIQRATAGEPHIDVDIEGEGRFIVGYTKERAVLIDSRPSH